jgi:Gas vesicle synthesis protein GvpL/GvpF
MAKKPAVTNKKKGTGKAAARPAARDRSPSSAAAAASGPARKTPPNLRQTPAAAPPRRREVPDRAAPTKERGGGDPAAKGRYVYCIVRSDQPLDFGPIGIGDEPSPVYTVRCDDLSAIVSDAPLGVLDPTRDNVLAHQRVNETVMRDYTVLPMSFGTVFKTRDDVATFLKSAYRAFSDVLDKMENKLEFGLKVLWDRDAVIREIEEDDEDIHRLKSEIAAQKGSTYFARMQYGRLIDGALQAKSERYVGEIFDRLRDVSVAARANKPIGDRMILNAAFLVTRDTEEEFDARVKELGASNDKLTFKYTGPWPPYNFVNIRLKLERA